MQKYKMLQTLSKDRKLYYFPLNKSAIYTVGHTVKKTLRKT